MYNKETYVQLNFDALFSKAVLYSKDNSNTVPLKTKLMPGSHSLSVTCGKINNWFVLSPDSANSCTVTYRDGTLSLSYSK